MRAGQRQGFRIHEKAGWTAQTAYRQFNSSPTRNLFVLNVDGSVFRVEHENFYAFDSHI